MLNLYKLEIFEAVATVGSFSAAARRLLLTQPAVSQHIADLEAGLGTPLFLRGSRGVSLTQAGETLLDYTRCILRMLAEAETAIQELNQVSGGQLALAATPGVSVHLLPGWLNTFSQRYPGARLSVSTEVTAQVLKGLLEERFDLGFVEGEMQAETPLEAMVLRELHLKVVVGSEHPWRERETVPLQMLDGQPFITRPPGSQTRAWIDQVLGQHGITPKIVAEMDHPEAIQQAVARGLGISVLPDWGPDAAGAGSIHALTVEGASMTRTLKLVRNTSSPLKRASRAFLVLLTDEFPQLSRILG